MHGIQTEQAMRREGRHQGTQQTPAAQAGWEGSARRSPPSCFDRALAANAGMHGIQGGF